MKSGHRPHSLAHSLAPALAGTCAQCSVLRSIGIARQSDRPAERLPAISSTSTGAMPRANLRRSSIGLTPLALLLLAVAPLAAIAAGVWGQELPVSLSTSALSRTRRLLGTGSSSSSGPGDGEEQLPTDDSGSLMEWEGTAPSDGADSTQQQPSGATTTNGAPQDCLKGNLSPLGDPVTCDVFATPTSVWLSGASTSAVLGDGNYFFAVVERDGKDALDNLQNGALPTSCLSTTPRAARAFKIQGGVMTKLTTATNHTLLNNKLQLFPFRSTVASDNRYTLLVCPLPAANNINATVKPDRCKSDSFAINPDAQAPLPIGWCAVRIRMHKKPENDAIAPLQSEPDALRAFTRLADEMAQDLAARGFSMLGKNTTLSRCGVPDPTGFRCATRLTANFFTTGSVAAGALLTAIRATEEVWVREWAHERKFDLNCLDDIVLDSANSLGVPCASEVTNQTIPLVGGFVAFTGANDETTYRRVTPFLHTFTSARINTNSTSGAPFSGTFNITARASPPGAVPWFGCRTSREGEEESSASCAVSLTWAKHFSSNFFGTGLRLPANITTALPNFTIAIQSGYSNAGGAPSYLGWTNSSRLLGTTGYSTALFSSNAEAQAASDLLWASAISSSWLREYVIRPDVQFTCYDGVIIESFPARCAGPPRLFGGAGSSIAWSGITGLGLSVLLEDYNDDVIGCKAGPLCSVRVFYQRLRFASPDGAPLVPGLYPLNNTVYNNTANAFTAPGVNALSLTPKLQGGPTGTNTQQGFFVWVSQSGNTTTTCPTPFECAFVEQRAMTIPFAGADAGLKAGFVNQFITASATSPAGAAASWLASIPVGLLGFKCYDFVSIENAPDGCARDPSNPSLPYFPIGNVWTGVPKEWMRSKPYPNLGLADPINLQYGHVVVPEMSAGCTR